MMCKPGAKLFLAGFLAGLKPALQGASSAVPWLEGRVLQDAIGEGVRMHLQLNIHRPEGL